jgi:hypothetical protein
MLRPAKHLQVSSLTLHSITHSNNVIGGTSEATAHITLEEKQKVRSIAENIEQWFYDQLGKNSTSSTSQLMF